MNQTISPTRAIVIVLGTVIILTLALVYAAHVSAAKCTTVAHTDAVAKDIGLPTRLDVSEYLNKGPANEGYVGILYTDLESDEGSAGQGALFVFGPDGCLVAKELVPVEVFLPGPST